MVAADSGHLQATPASCRRPPLHPPLDRQRQPKRARTFIVELTEHFQRLADLHLRHRFVPELGPDIRIAVHGNYNIYYRFIGDHGRDVLIIRVLWGGRDLREIEMD